MNHNAMQAEGSRLEFIVGQNPYRVNVHFNHTATENMGDKIMRLIRNEVESTVFGLSGGDSLCLLQTHSTPSKKH